MLEIKGLNKSYGRNKVLSDLDLILEEDKIYGLLGRNGVGKTTLLKLISGQLNRNSGDIKIDGIEIFENQSKLEQICLIREFSNSVKELKVKDILFAARSLFKDWDNNYGEFLIKEFNLNTRKKFMKLSSGNQTVVGLIIGLASRSRITIFDEPTGGLDAAMRYKFYNLLLDDYERNPRTIIISTHLIDEVSNLFEEVIILNNKKVALQEDVDSLKNKSYFLAGRAGNIDQIVRDKKVIHSEEFGSTKIVGIFGQLKDEEINELKMQNIEISNIPLQKLFIYLTENISKEEK